MLYYLRAVARGVLDVKEVIAGHSPYMAKIFGIVRSWSTSNFRWPRWHTLLTVSLDARQVMMHITLLVLMFFFAKFATLVSGKTRKRD